MPRLQPRPHTANAPAPPMPPQRADTHATNAPAATPDPSTGASPSVGNDDWLRSAMAHWLEDDAPAAFARMGDGH